MTMNVIELLKAVVLGMTEGFTEWLPVSAAAHLMLMERILRPDVPEGVMPVFYAVLKLGASLAVLFMYWPRLSIWSGSRKKQRAAFRLQVKIALGTLPAAVPGLLLYEWTSEHLNSGYLISLMLILFGAAFVIVERRRKYRRPETDLLRKITPHTALYAGMFQVLGLLPGVSRTGAAILGCLLFGFSARTAAEFSVLLGIPLTAGAALFTLIRNGIPAAPGTAGFLAAGFLAAFFVSLNAVRFLVARAKKKNFAVYGWYRIALGAVFVIWTFLSALVS